MKENKNNNSSRWLVWKADDIPCDRLPECFFEMLRREGVIE